MTGRNLHFGLALAGGGARGAYTAGVMRFLFCHFPEQLGYTPWPNLVSGTSVGALNGYFAASHSLEEIRRMTEIWSQLQTGQIYEFPINGAFSAIRRLFQVTRSGALFNQEPLRKLIIQEATRRGIRQSIGEGRCRAFIVSATHLTSGENTLFIDTRDPDFHIPQPPQGRIIYTKIYPHHLMASAAIPLVFPPENIDNQFYVDGGVRQNAPLQPILQAGAERVLVLGTRTQKPYQPSGVVEPSLALIAGKTLNALTLDPVERDARTVETLNNIIQWGSQKYGQEFAQELQKKFGVKPIKFLHIRPSQDLGQLAIQAYDSEQIEASVGAKWLLHKIFEAGVEDGESDLLSQLLFDRTFTAAAERLGFNDAKAHTEQLLEFFC